MMNRALLDNSRDHRIEERKQLKIIVAHQLSKHVLFFHMCLPSNLEHRQAVVQYVRATTVKYHGLDNEKEAVTNYIKYHADKVVKTKKKYIRPSVTFLDDEQLEFHILVAWALCQDNTDEPAWIPLEFKEILNNGDSKKSEYKYHPWLMLYKGLGNKFDDVFKVRVRTVTRIASARLQICNNGPIEIISCAYVE